MVKKGVGLESYAQGCEIDEINGIDLMDYEECLAAVQQDNFVSGFVDSQSSIEYVYSYFEKSQKKRIVA